MSTRRDTVKSLAALLAAGLLPRAARGLPALLPAARIDRIGVQLYTVRQAMAKDIAGTLAAVAKLGYREVEFAGYFGKTPAEVRAMLNANGLTSPSVHIGAPELRKDFSAIADSAHVIGHQYLTVPSLDMRALKTADAWKRQADEFNEFGRKAKAAGLRLAFHNHDREFTPVEGQVPMDLLLAGTDRTLVAFEMDLYWISKAGIDPRTYFARFPGRFEMVHVKDGAGADLAMTEVGSGRLDWKGIFAKQKEAGIKHYFVEHDEPANPLDSIRQSYNYLEALRF